MRKFIKPVDLIVVACVLICSFLIILAPVSDAAATAVIFVNGNEYGRYSIDSNEAQTIEVFTEYGYNVVVVEDRKVRVSESNCKDKVEINAGSISRPGQSLVCLPNRLVVTIEGGAVTDATTF